MPQHRRWSRQRTESSARRIEWLDNVEDRLARHRSMLLALSISLATAHALMAVLYLIGRAAPAITPVGMPSWLKVLILSGDDGFWIVLHGSAALGLCVALWTGRLRALAAYWSQTVWAMWCLIILLWSLWTAPPVPLVAPLIVPVLAVPLGRVVAGAWTDEEIPTSSRG